MPLRNVATNYTFEQQRQEINLLAADVDTLDTSVTALQGLQATETSDSPTFTNLTLSGYLAGPATLTIDPAAVGDNTGTVVIAGNLQVDGTTTTINSTTMTVDDLNITLASGAANAAAANGAGLTVDGANATLLYNGTTDEWAFNKSLTSLSVNGSSTFSGQLNVGANMQFTAADPELEFNNGGPRFRVPAANTLTIHTGGGLGTTTSERLRITSDGKVGINETNPAAELEVGGSVWLKRSSSDQFADQFRARKDRGGQAVQDGDTVLTLMAQGFSSATSSYRDLARIDFEVDGTPQSGFADMPGSVVFKLGRESQSSLQETLKLHSDGQLTLNLPSNTTSRHIGIVNSSGTIGWTFGNGVVAAARQFVIYDNEAGAVRLKIDASGNVSDSIGNIRSLGLVSATSSFTIASDHAGKFIRQTTAGQTMTVPANVFGIGTMITIVNRSSGTQTIAQGSGVTMYNSADGSTGNRTLAANGMCTLLYTASNEVYISGAGLS